MLFNVYSTAFNTIILSKLVSKLQDLGLNQHLCCLNLDFLSDCPQSGRLTTIIHSNIQHWWPSGLCVKPNTVLSFHTWLHSCPRHKHNYKTCRRYDRDRADLWQQWTSLEGGAAVPNYMVLRKQPGSQHQQDQGAHHWQRTCHGAKNSSTFWSQSRNLISVRTYLSPSTTAVSRAYLLIGSPHGTPNTERSTVQWVLNTTQKIIRAQLPILEEIYRTLSPFYTMIIKVSYLILSYLLKTLCLI